MSLNLLKKNTETRFRTVDITEGSMLDPWMGYGPCKAKLSGISLDHHSQSRLTALTRGTVEAAWGFLDQCGDRLMAPIEKPSAWGSL